MTNFSTSNQKGIIRSFFLMSIFCQRSGCFTQPGGVSVCACACVSVYMSDEIFGNRREGLIITDISLDAFRPRSSWGAACVASRPQSERAGETEGVGQNFGEKKEGVGYIR